MTLGKEINVARAHGLVERLCKSGSLSEMDQDTLLCMERVYDCPLEAFSKETAEAWLKKKGVSFDEVDVQRVASRLISNDAFVDNTVANFIIEEYLSEK